MDIGTVGVGAIIGATITVIVNIILHQKNRQYDRAKEQLVHLYSPLNAIINKKLKYLTFLKHNNKKSDQYPVEYYKFFIELQDIYLKNEVYASLELRAVFYELHHNYEMEYFNYSQCNNNKEDILKGIATFELTHGIDKEDNSEIEQKVNKLIEVLNSDIHKIYHKNQYIGFIKKLPNKV